MRRGRSHLPLLARAGLALALGAVTGCSGAGGAPPRAPTSALPAYRPDVGDTMSLFQMRHIKLWWAGQAANWPLASYELDELEEGLDGLVAQHPRFERQELAELVPRFTGAPIRALRAAIEQRDVAAFAAAHDALSAGCNGCHETLGFPFNVIQRPASNPYADQRFEP